MLVGHALPCQLTMIRVLLVDDNGQFRAVLRRLLEREADIEVIDEADNGRSAVEAAVTQQPDLVLMDVSMPRLDGIAATRELRDEAPHISVVLLSIGNKPQEVAAGLAAGAAKYMVKGATANEIVDVVRRYGGDES